jgi:microsomal dipeptidase-like Zn-dependent dipeptidase
MLADLHAHYPMHLSPGMVPSTPGSLPGTRRANLLDRMDARVMGLAGRIWNYESLRAGPRVTIDRLLEGDVNVALSVLVAPLLETGNRLTKLYRRRPPYGGPPKDSFFPGLLRQLELVERRIAERHDDRALVAHNSDELDAGLEEGKLVLIHCVEGGFHLGASPTTIEDAVAELARRGVAYITLAHLFWRHFATNEAAVPFLSDRLYQRLFPQPELGLSDLGRAAVMAMVREGVLIDATHMSERAIADTFTLLDDLDPDYTVPVIASHVGYRFGGRAYNLDQQTVGRIAARGGLIGLILSEHFIADGLRTTRTHSFEESFELLCEHIDRISQITGSYRHIALGSDLDGFIKPTLAGFEHSGCLAGLEKTLADRYGDDIASLIASQNALRLLRSHWRSKVPQDA